MAENPDEDHSSFTNSKGFLNHDCTEKDEDQNPQEESRPIVSDASASNSSINEANKKTDSSSSSSNKTGEISKRKLSPYAKPWSPNNFRRPDHDCTDAMFSNVEDGEASRPDLYMPVSSSARNPETGSMNRKLSALAPPFIQQPHTRPNLGSPSLSSNPNAVPCDTQTDPQQVVQPDPQTELPMADVSELNRQQVLQPKPQSTEQQPTKTEESDAESSSHQSG